MLCGTCACYAYAAPNRLLAIRIMPVMEIMGHSVAFMAFAYVVDNRLSSGALRQIQRREQ